jgi:hypothetical protein
MVAFLANLRYTWHTTQGKRHCFGARSLGKTGTRDDIGRIPCLELTSPVHTKLSHRYRTGDRARCLRNANMQSPREMLRPVLCCADVLGLGRLPDHEKRRPGLSQSATGLPLRHSHTPQAAGLSGVRRLRLLRRRAKGFPGHLRRTRLAAGPSNCKADVRGVFNHAQPS